MKLRYILLLLLPLSVGCGAKKTATDGGARTAVSAQASESKETKVVRELALDKDQVWQLVAMQGREVAKGNRKSAEEVLLMFHPESGTVRGRVACNRYFADYKMKTGKTSSVGTHFSIDVDYISGGDVQCPEGDMALQDRYLNLLSKADAGLLAPHTLTLFQKDKEILRFELQ